MMTALYPTWAQSKARPAKELEALLPKISLSGFAREKPSTSSMNMSTDGTSLSISLASVNYQGEGISINVQLADYVTDQQSYSALCMPLNMNLSYENDQSKTTTKTYKGNRMLETTNFAVDGSEGSCAVTICVKDRFYLVINHEGSTDLQVVYKLLDDINLGAL